jgi:hypothetical protein
MRFRQIDGTMELLQGRTPNAFAAVVAVCYVVRRKIFRERFSFHEMGGNSSIPSQ